VSEAWQPDTRECAACKMMKPVEAFAFSDIARGRRQSYCRACNAAYRRAHYLRNKAEYIRRAGQQTIRRRIENRRQVRLYLLSHPCVDCGEADPLVLELDHRDPKERFGPSPGSLRAGVGSSLPRRSTSATSDVQIAIASARPCNSDGASYGAHLELRLEPPSGCVEVASKDLPKIRSRVRFPPPAPMIRAGLQAGRARHVSVETMSAPRI
jgi:hypothetical protein